NRGRSLLRGLRAARAGLIGLGGGFVATRTGLAVRRLLCSCRRLFDLRGGLGFVLVVVAAGSERSRRRGGCAHCRSCGRDLGSVLDRLERLFASLDDAVIAGPILRGLTAAPLALLRSFALRLCLLRHLGFL